MARFDHDTYRSLNESIAHVQNPQAALNEALEYTAALEAVLLSLCEELDLDPRDLMEDIQTPERRAEAAAQRKKQVKKLNTNLARFQKTKIGTAANERAYKSSRRESEKTGKMDAAHEREQRATTRLYGKGGKVVGYRRTPSGPWKTPKK
jgi:uncharacterized protein (DUF3084 family)